MKQRKVFLIGPMASGKTTVGKKLGRRLGCHFCDLDSLIVAGAGCGIGTIFAREGESGFRLREAAVMRQLIDRDAAVIATGGGAVLDAGSRELMKTGIVVYLKVSREARCKRIGGGCGRPLLDGEKIKEKIKELDHIRTPLYREVADLEVENNGTVDEAVEEIVRLLEDGNENSKS